MLLHFNTKVNSLLKMEPLVNSTNSAVPMVKSVWMNRRNATTGTIAARETIPTKQIVTSPHARRANFVAPMQSAFPTDGGAMATPIALMQ